MSPTSALAVGGANERQVPHDAGVGQYSARRILYFNSWSSAHGGSSTSLIDIVARLDRTRYEPLVVCPEPGDLPDRLVELGVPVVIHPLSTPTLRQWWRFLAEVPWYVRLLRTRRIALVHGNTSASRRSLIQAASLCGIPYIQHVRNPVRRTQGKFGFHSAARIITNSVSVGADLRDDPEFARKMCTVYNGVDLTRYADDSNCRSELGAEHRPVVGFVGQIVPRKGVSTLIQAMPEVIRSCPGAMLAVVGCAPPGETEYESECRRMVRTLSLERSVVFTGYRRDVPAWMRTFDIFALPTRAEPFGKVVIEAMAAGCPVVVSGVGGIPEIVSSPSLGTLIAPDDPGAAASAIIKYLSDTRLARHVGDSGRQHVRTHFSLGAMVEKLQEIYGSVLAESRAHA